MAEEIILKKINDNTLKFVLNTNQTLGIDESSISIKYNKKELLIKFIEFGGQTLLRYGYPNGEFWKIIKNQLNVNQNIQIFFLIDSMDYFQ